MKIRFRAFVDSDVPGFPFRPGQVIDVATPTPEILALLEVRADGSYVAEAVKDEGELAIVGTAPERAVKHGRAGRDTR